MSYDTDWGTLEPATDAVPGLMPEDNELPIGLDCALFDDLCMVIRTMSAEERLAFIDRIETEAAGPWGFAPTASVDIALPL